MSLGGCWQLMHHLCHKKRKQTPEELLLTNPIRSSIKKSKTPDQKEKRISLKVKDSKKWKKVKKPLHSPPPAVGSVSDEDLAKLGIRVSRCVLGKPVRIDDDSPDVLPEEEPGMLSDGAEPIVVVFTRKSQNDKAPERSSSTVAKEISPTARISSKIGITAVASKPVIISETAVVPETPKEKSGEAEVHPKEKQREAKLQPMHDTDEPQLEDKDEEAKPQPKDIADEAKTQPKEKEEEAEPQPKD